MGKQTAKLTSGPGTTKLQTSIFGVAPKPAAAKPAPAKPVDPVAGKLNALGGSSGVKPLKPVGGKPRAKQTPKPARTAEEQMGILNSLNGPSESVTRPVPKPVTLNDVFAGKAPARRIVQPSWTQMLGEAGVPTYDETPGMVDAAKTLTAKRRQTKGTVEHAMAEFDRAGEVPADVRELAKSYIFSRVNSGASAGKNKSVSGLVALKEFRAAERAGRLDEIAGKVDQYRRRRSAMENAGSYTESEFQSYTRELNEGFARTLEQFEDNLGGNYAERVFANEKSHPAARALARLWSGAVTGVGQTLQMPADLVGDAMIAGGIEGASTEDRLGAGLNVLGKGLGIAGTAAGVGVGGKMVAAGGAKNIAKGLGRIAYELGPIQNPFKTPKALQSSAERMAGLVKSGKVNKAELEKVGDMLGEQSAFKTPEAKKLIQSYANQVVKAARDAGAPITEREAVAAGRIAYGMHQTGKTVDGQKMLETLMFEGKKSLDEAVMDAEFPAAAQAAPKYEPSWMNLREPEVAKVEAAPGAAASRGFGPPPKTYEDARKRLAELDAENKEAAAAMDKYPTTSGVMAGLVTEEGKAMPGYAQDRARIDRVVAEMQAINEYVGKHWPKERAKFYAEQKAARLKSVAPKSEPKAAVEPKQPVIGAFEEVRPDPFGNRVNRKVEILEVQSLDNIRGKSSEGNWAVNLRVNAHGGGARTAQSTQYFFRKADAIKWLREHVPGWDEQTAAPAAHPKAEVKQKEPWEMTHREYLESQGFPAEVAATVVREKAPKGFSATRTVLRASGRHDTLVLKPVRGDGRYLKATINGKPASRSDVHSAIGISADPSRIPYNEFVAGKTRDDFGYVAPPWHRWDVEKALREGKPVPAEVLADYPDLKPKAEAPKPEPKSQTPEAGKKVEGVDVQGDKPTYARSGSKKYPVKWKLVELDDIHASHDDDKFTQNPKWKGAGQPRDRGRTEDRLQVDGMARNLDPEQHLEITPGLTQGSPVIDALGNVEHGNGRTMSMKRARRMYPEKWAEYQKAIREQYPESANMKNPVLVRERVDDGGLADDKAMSEYLRQGSAPEGKGLSTTEVARADASRLRDGFWDNLEARDGSFVDALNNSANDEIVTNFAKTLLDSERAMMMDAKGNISVEGIRRIERAALHSLLGDNGAANLERLLESGDDIGKRMADGLKLALGRLLPVRTDRMAELINDGLNEYIKFKSSKFKGNFDEYVDQGRMDGFDQTAIDLVKRLHEASSKGGSSGKVADVFADLASTMKGEHAARYQPPLMQQNRLFDEGNSASKKDASQADIAGAAKLVADGVNRGHYEDVASTLRAMGFSDADMNLVVLKAGGDPAKLTKPSEESIFGGLFGEEQGSLFQKLQPTVTKGQYRWDDKQKKGIVTLLKQSDVTTVIHETAHHHLKYLPDVQFRAVAKLAGAKATEFDNLGEEDFVNVQEFYARAVEDALFKGKMSFGDKHADIAVRTLSKRFRELYPEGVPAPEKWNPKRAKGGLNQLTDAQKKQTQTPEFEKWFGDSKVVDENGEPLVVYHGTDSGFDVFNRSMSGKNSDVKEGFFFSSDIGIAATYGVERVPTYLKMDNPYVLDAEGRDWWSAERTFKDGIRYERDTNEIAQDAFNAGHDGVIVRNVIDSADDDVLHESDIYVVFDPTQIKSAIGNKGTFDPNDPSILNQNQGPSGWQAPDEFHDMFAQMLAGTGKVERDIPKMKTAPKVEAPAEGTRPASFMSHAQDAAIRDAIGADAYEKVTRKDKAVVAAAKGERGKTAEHMATAASGKPLSDVQQVALALDIEDALKQRHALLTAQKGKVSPADMAALSEVERKLTDGLNALAMAGSEAGRALRIRQLTMGGDYSEMGITQAYVKATGKVPNPETAVKIKELTARIEELEAKLAARRKASLPKYEKAVDYFTKKQTETVNQKGRPTLNQLSAEERGHVNAIINHHYEEGLRGKELIDKVEDITGVKRSDVATQVKRTTSAKRGKLTAPDERAQLYREQSELADLLDRETRKAVWQESGFGGKAKIGLKEARDSITSLVSSTDFSGSRQALYGMLANPKAGVKAFMSQFKTAFSEKQYDKILSGMQAEAKYWEALDNGVELMGKPNFKEEQFRGRAIEKVPVAGALVKGSDRAYSILSTQVRYEVYKSLTKHAKTPQDLKLAAEVANIMTGRAGTGKAKSLLVNEVGRTLLWAPSFTASRLQMPFLWARVISSKASPRVKMAAIRQYGQAVAILGGIGYAVAARTGGEFVTDKDSNDFGLVILPNGDKYDAWGGSKQAVRLYLDMVNPKRDGSYFNSQENIVSRASKFAQGKLNPSMSIGLGLAQREDAIGQGFGVRDAGKRMLPLGVTMVGDDVAGGRFQEEWKLATLGALGNMFGLFDIRDKKPKSHYAQGRARAERYQTMPFLKYLAESARGK